MRGSSTFVRSVAPPLAAATPTQPEKQTAHRSVGGASGCGDDGDADGEGDDGEDEEEGSGSTPQCALSAETISDAVSSAAPPAVAARAESSAVAVSSQMAPPTRAADSAQRAAHARPWRPGAT